MTDEEKRVVKNEYEKRWVNHPNSDEFIAAVEARLSPKQHPKKGATCEVQLELSGPEGEALSKAWLAYSDGQGGATEYADGSGNVWRNSNYNKYHHREIPTAQNALKALTDELDNDEAIYSHDDQYLAGKAAACVVVRRLIANAETG